MNDCTFSGCERPQDSLGLCTAHWKQHSRGKKLVPLIQNAGWGGRRSKPSPSTTDNFLELLDRSASCWYWTRAIHQHGGYGLITWYGKSRTTHRLAYELFKGPVPSGLSVLHRCDNPPCCNPDHLIAGTAKQNAQERKERRGSIRGSEHPSGKLNEGQVLAIKAHLAAGIRTQKQLAEENNVSQSLISAIKKGILWSWLDES